VRAASPMHGLSSVSRPLLQVHSMLSELLEQEEAVRSVVCNRGADTGGGCDSATSTSPSLPQCLGEDAGNYDSPVVAAAPTLAPLAVTVSPLALAAGAPFVPLGGPGTPPTPLEPPSPLVVAAARGRRLAAIRASDVSSARARGARGPSPGSPLRVLSPVPRSYGSSTDGEVEGEGNRVVDAV
jgi:hypothetical protein